MEMRRGNLAITDAEKIDAIITGCTCLRLAFTDGPCPYIVPLSFGYVHKDNQHTFYFHGADQGRKVALARALGCAGFELDNGGTLLPGESACSFSVRYQSVIGEGTLREITNAQEKADALCQIMHRYTQRAQWSFPAAALKKTVVFRLDACHISVKEHL